MKLRPLHDRVIVKRLDTERKTSSGIVIPDNAAEKPDQGEILAVGNGKIQEDGKVRPMAVRLATKCSLASTAARPSRLTARNCSSCAKKTSWQSWSNRSRSSP